MHRDCRLAPCALLRSRNSPYQTARRGCSVAGLAPSSKACVGNPCAAAFMSRYFLRSRNRSVATNSRCQRKIVSGVTMVAISCSALRPNTFPLAARLRRWSSPSRMRFLPNFSLSTRFSVSRYSITSYWWRLIQPARMIRNSCQDFRTCFMSFPTQY